MSVQTPTPPAKEQTPGAKTRSFLLWAFLISIGLHFVILPFFGLKHQENEKETTEKVSVSKKIRVVVPTPPPPVKQTNPPPQPKLKLNVPKSTSKGPSTETKYVPPPVGSENAVPNGTTATGKPTEATAAPAATPAPTPTPAPKPQCAVPNAEANIKGEAADLEYPDIAREQGAVGTTLVKVTLDANGNVTDTSVYKSAGNAALDQSAIKAAKATSYTPDIVDCVKTPGSYLFKANFDAQ
jgi:TonB family protein